MTQRKAQTTKELPRSPSYSAGYSAMPCAERSTDTLLLLANSPAHSWHFGTLDIDDIRLNGAIASRARVLLQRIIRVAQHLNGDAPHPDRIAHVPMARTSSRQRPFAASTVRPAPRRRCVETAQRVTEW
jgi:hypothetical protein